jgi:cleavage and polyadenylation specificity factor subunit 2
MTKDVYCPTNNEEAVIGDDIDSFSLRLDDELVAALKMRRVEDYDIIKLDGSILIPDVSSIPVISSRSGSSSGSTFSYASLVRSFQTARRKANSEKPKRLPPLGSSLYIGDVRLAVLKARLLALNIPSSFAGEGILVCGPAPSAKQKAQSKDPKARLQSKSRTSATPDVGDGDRSGGKVAVRKHAEGSLVLEGQPGETFELVRQAVYSGLASTS